MKLQDISEISQLTGIASSAIRHYEEKGLVVSVGRRGLKRLFGPEVIDQLALITLGKAAGFSLDEIRSMFGPDGRPAVSRMKLYDKAKDLERQIQRLSSLRDMIRHVADCPAPTHMECPKFLQLLRLSNRQKMQQASAGVRTVPKKPRDR